jgi:hypothetical protein
MHLNDGADMSRRFAMTVFVLGLSLNGCTPSDETGDGDGGEGEGEGERCGDGVESVGADIVIADRVTGTPAFLGQGLRDGVLLDEKFIGTAGNPDASFFNACTRCSGGSGPGYYDAGDNNILNIIEFGGDDVLIDGTVARAWSADRVAAAAAGAQTFGIEVLQVAPDWSIRDSTIAGPDHAYALATDKAVSAVKAGAWLAVSLELVGGNDCAIEQIALLMDTVVDPDERNAAFSKVLVESAGRVLIAVASTLAPEVLATVDTTACTTADVGACLDVAFDGYGALQFKEVVADDLEVVTSGADDTWQPFVFSTTNFAAAGE